MNFRERKAGKEKVKVHHGVMKANLRNALLSVEWGWRPLTRKEDGIKIFDFSQWLSEWNLMRW